MLEGDAGLVFIAGAHAGGVILGEGLEAAAREVGGCFWTAQGHMVGGGGVGAVPSGKAVRKYGGVQSRMECGSDGVIKAGGIGRINCVVPAERR